MCLLTFPVSCFVFLDHSVFTMKRTAATEFEVSIPGYTQVPLARQVVQVVRVAVLVASSTITNLTETFYACIHSSY